MKADRQQIRKIKEKLSISEANCNNSAQTTMKSDRHQIRKIAEKLSISEI